MPVPEPVDLSRSDQSALYAMLGQQRDELFGQR